MYTPSSPLRQAELIADMVREMDRAAYYAIAWTRPALCEIDGAYQCAHAGCLAHAADHAARWARLAARCASILETLVLYHEPESVIAECRALRPAIRARRIH